MRLGFTGTQEGGTKAQRLTLIRILKGLDVAEAHFGDCIGWDADAYFTTKELKPAAILIGHPPTNPSKREFLPYDITFKKASYLTRNKHIVNNSDLLIAAPKTMEEEQRSGTWATIRYARRRKIDIIIIWPDGSKEVIHAYP